MADSITGDLRLRRYRIRIGVDGIRPATVAQRHEQGHHQDAEYRNSKPTSIQLHYSSGPSALIPVVH